mmetsp:Transcript_44391/g.118429  ORF Transcript_44391/g.118429 Transcript_44391/m.118429 type:complete len:221 (+) Transcript_44391:142-804(+)
MMVESIHMSLASFSELASRLGFASTEMKALGTSVSFSAMFRSLGRWIWTLPQDLFGLCLRLLALLLAWAGFRAWRRHAARQEEEESARSRAQADDLEVADRETSFNPMSGGGRGAPPQRREYPPGARPTGQRQAGQHNGGVRAGAAGGRGPRGTVASEEANSAQRRPQGEFVDEGLDGAWGPPPRRPAAAARPRLPPGPQATGANSNSGSIGVVADVEPA